MTEPKLRVLLMYRGTFLIQYLQVTPSCRGHKAHRIIRGKRDASDREPLRLYVE